MIENYLNSTIWNYFMKNEYVQKGLKILDFQWITKSIVIHKFAKE